MAYEGTLTQSAMSGIVSAGVTLPANVYPKGTVTISGKWRNSKENGDLNVHIYVCDSAGNNTIDMGSFYIQGASSMGPNDEAKTLTATGVDKTGLMGKALYVKATKNSGVAGLADLKPYGAKITVNTATSAFPVTVSSVTGGSASVSPSTATPGSAVTITPTESTGYRYIGFTTSPSVTHLSDRKFTMPSSAVTVTPIFEKISYSITKVADPAAGGSVSVKKNGAEVSSANYGDTLVVSCTPSVGYDFLSWSGSQSSETSYTMTMPANNITIQASFVLHGYNITKGVSPSGAGSVSGPAKANMGDTVILNQSPEFGYLFTNWSSNEVTVSGNQFVMPASDVSVTANYHLGRSTGALNKSSYMAGETAVLTISSEDPSFTHRYKLSFGTGMESDFVNVAAGVLSVNIYIPVEWSKNLLSATKTGGVLTLETYSNGSLFGSYEITGLSYTALNNTIPKLTVRRAKDSGAYKVNGKRASYSISVPQGTTYKLICQNKTKESPASSGILLPDNVLNFPIGESCEVELEITYGSETFNVTESVPRVVLMTKRIVVGN